MTLDEMTEALAISDQHAKDLVAEGIIRGGFKRTTAIERRRVKGKTRNIPITRTVWTVSGPDVRAYKKDRGR